MIGPCRICRTKEEEVKHLPLYISGSEGLEICHGCEMVLIDIIIGMVSVVSHCKRSLYKEMHK